MEYKGDKMDQQYDEISLRELIENLLKNKRLIALMIVGALIIASAYTFFIVNDVYESRATIQVNLGNIIDSQIQKDGTNIEVYKEQIKSNDVLSAVIDELQLDMMVENLAQKITISNEQSSNFITIIVSDSDPQVATDIANSVVNQFIIKMNTIALNQYKNKEVTMVSEYEDNRFLLEEAIRKNKALIISLGDELHNISPTFTVDKNILEDAFTTQLAKSISNDLSEMTKFKVLNEEVNPVYVSTLERVTNEKIDLLTNQEALVSLENQYNYDTAKLLEDIKKQEALIDALKVGVGDAKTTARLSQNNVVVVSDAVKPNYPVTSNKTLSLAIGGVLGLMLGVFIALFKEYWIKSKPSSIAHS